jgi:hypothetical protein
MLVKIDQGEGRQMLAVIFYHAAMRKLRIVDSSGAAALPSRDSHGQVLVRGVTDLLSSPRNKSGSGCAA